MGNDFLPMFMAQAIAQEMTAVPRREHITLSGQPGPLAGLVRNLVKRLHRA